MQVGFAPAARCYNPFEAVNAVQALVIPAKEHHPARADIGTVGVLYIWTRDAGFHSHSYLLIPACRTTQEGKRWNRAKPDLPDYVKELIGKRRGNTD